MVHQFVKVRRIKHCLPNREYNKKGGGRKEGDSYLGVREGGKGRGTGVY